MLKIIRYAIIGFIIGAILALLGCHGSNPMFWIVIILVMMGLGMVEDSKE